MNNKRTEKWLKEHPEVDTKKFNKIEGAVLEILDALGEDPTREDLVDTPHRVAKMLLGETMIGYKYGPKELADLAGSSTFSQNHTGNVVLVKDIQFFSNCSHHMVPFFGKVHVAYIPNGKVLGLSKIPRVVKMASKKLQLQENLGQEIADAIATASNAKAVVVIIDSDMHLCVASRGVEDYSSNATTIATAGQEEGWGVSRSEFLDTVFKMLGR
jgi:GTP cyclohydrolase I